MWAYWAFALLIVYLCLVPFLPMLGRYIARRRDADTVEYGEH